MARVRATKPELEPLVIDLAAPGMTPLLRSGLGGLAAALRFRLIESKPKAPWPSDVVIAGGVARVERRRIVIDWRGNSPAIVLQDLFEHAFRISKVGIIDLAGTYERSTPPGKPLAIALQKGLETTFLQHPLATKKAGAVRTAQEEIDDGRFVFSWQPHKAFNHQHAWKAMVKRTGFRSRVRLAGWAYPGAAQKHVRYAETRADYQPAEALCACFAIVGCPSFQVRPGGLGALVVIEPSDLVEYAVTRPRLTPMRPADAYVSSVGDAVLQTRLALLMDRLSRTHRGVAATHGMLLKPLPWASRQKSRARTVDGDEISDQALDLFLAVAQALPARLRPTDKGEEEADAGYFVATSALRAFVADNLALGYAWYHGFASATIGAKKPRYIHYYRDREGRGALYPEEKKGLKIMLKYLEDAERSLVRSVHEALRQRFGRIYDETKGLPKPTRDNRFDAERERWRLAFAGSKTHDQIRGALASLWSLGGVNKELRSSWQEVLPLLRPATWQAARDLALVALASYQGAERTSENESATTGESAA